MDAIDRPARDALDRERVAWNSPSGWFPFGAVGKVAEWNGRFWTGARSPMPELGAPPKWRRPTHAGHVSWVWWLIVGQALCVLSALLGVVTHNAHWDWTSILGYGIFMIGSVRLGGRFLRFDELPRRRNLIVIGVASGAVASALAFGLEYLANGQSGIGVTLWLAGPIEELSKLLIPGILLFWGTARFKDPITGLFLVICSGATFGAIEGALWQTQSNPRWLHVMFSLIRPGVELFHPYVTGFAAAIIWLAAARAGHVWTKIGTLALVVIVAVHSFHDGIADFVPVPKGQKRFGVEPIYSASQAFIHGLTAGAAGWGLSLMFLVLLRHSARELVAPTSLPTTPPRWRPRLKQWGYLSAKYAPHTVQGIEGATT